MSAGSRFREILAGNGLVEAMESIRDVLARQGA